MKKYNMLLVYYIFMLFYYIILLITRCFISLSCQFNLYIYTLLYLRYFIIYFSLYIFHCVYYIYAVLYTYIYAVIYIYDVFFVFFESWRWKHKQSKQSIRSRWQSKMKTTVANYSASAKRGESHRQLCFSGDQVHWGQLLPVRLANWWASTSDALDRGSQ